MSVVNPQGFIANALKKGKVKDLHRFSESVCMTCDGAEDALMFGGGEWKSDIEFILRKRDVYRRLFTLNNETIAETIKQFVHDPTVNKITYEGKTFISDDKVREPIIDGDIIRLSRSQASFIVEYLFVKFNADTQTALWKCSASACECVVAVSMLTGSWRLYFVPGELRDQVSMGSMKRAGIDIVMAEVIPGGCTFLEMQCLEDGWRVACGVNISSRCDIYFDTSCIEVLVRPQTDPLVQAEVQTLHTVISSARRLFENTIHETSVVKSKVISKDLLTFTVVKKKGVQ